MLLPSLAGDAAGLQRSGPWVALALGSVGTMLRAHPGTVGAEPPATAAGVMPERVMWLLAAPLSPEVPSNAALANSICPPAPLA